MNSRWMALATIIFNALCFGQSGARTDQVEDASAQVKEISATELKAWLSSGRKFTLIDVREDSEWQAGHATAATHIPRGVLPGKIAGVVPGKDATIVLYCLGGVRSAAAAVALQKLGYVHVYSLSGGFRQYQAAGLPVEK